MIGRPLAALLACLAALAPVQLAAQDAAREPASSAPPPDASQTPQAIPETLPGTTPISTPVSAPVSTPNSTPATIPDATPAIPATVPEAEAPADPEVTRLKFLTAWDDRYEGTQFIAYRYGEMLTKASGGRFAFSFSGPEVVKFKQQLQPTASGVFDMNLSVAPYYFTTTSVPMAYFALPPDSALWREKGYWQFSDREFSRFNLKLVAHVVGGAGGDEFHIMLKEPLAPVDKPLAGRRIRGNIFYQPIIEPLGGAIVTLAGPDIHGAMKTGEADGAAWPVLGAVNFRWHEVAKYMTRPRFGASPFTVTMNMDRFKKMSRADQDLLLSVGRLLEDDASKAFDRATEEEIEKLKGFGVQETHLDPTVAARLNRGFRIGIWNLARANASSKDRAEALWEMAQKNGHAP